MNVSRNNGFCTYVVWAYFFILPILCEARAVIAVKNVTVLSRTIFSCAGDRLAQKKFLCRIAELCRSV